MGHGEVTLVTGAAVPSLPPHFPASPLSRSREKAGAGREAEDSLTHCALSTAVWSCLDSSS